MSAGTFAAGLREVVRHRGWLEKSQWLPAAQLRRWQAVRLAKLIHHAREHVPYYAERLAGIDLGGKRAGEQWRRIPILSKAIVREQAAQLRSRALESDAGIARRSTSGSTAEPLTIVKEMRPRLGLWAAKLRTFDWYGTDFRGTVVSLRPLRSSDRRGTVRRTPHWGSPLRHLFQTGRYCRADIFMPLEAQLELLEAEQPSYLVTFPTHLRLLLRALRDAGRRLPTLRYVQTLGEQLDPELRGECREVLGVPLYDTYGCTEADQIAVHCPSHDQYHVQDELNLVEILADDGRPCRPGEIGRVVVTPLHTYAMPLLRYEVGDYAELGAACPCGRGLTVLKRVLGRRQALLTLPSGEKRMAPYATRIFATLAAVRQFQIAQVGAAQIEVRLATRRALTDGETRQIVDGFANQLGPGFGIALKFVPAIPRLPGGKFMEFVSEL